MDGTVSSLIDDAEESTGGGDEGVSMTGDGSWRGAFFRDSVGVDRIGFEAVSEFTMMINI